MRLLIISALYAPYGRGGAERIARQRAVQAQAAGYQVSVLTLQPWQGVRSLGLQTEVDGGVLIHRFFALNIFSYITIGRHPLWQRLVWHALDLGNLHSWFVVRQIVKEFRPDKVEVHVAKGIGYSIFCALRSLGARWQLVLHDVQYVVPSGLLLVGQESILGRWWCRTYTAICRWLIGSPTEVLSPTQWLLDFYTHRGFFPYSEKKVELAFGALPPVQQLNLTPDHQPVRLLFVGQIETHKGIEWLIAQLQDNQFSVPAIELKQFHLDIVGDGSRLEVVKQLVAGDERFTVWGRVPAERLPEFFSRVDFTIVPSQCYENAPTIIAESLQAGVPVITNKIGGIGEMVVEEVNGLFV